jgi:hypothetical protein
LQDLGDALVLLVMCPIEKDGRIIAGSHECGDVKDGSRVFAGCGVPGGKIEAIALWHPPIRMWCAAIKNVAFTIANVATGTSNNS